MNRNKLIWGYRVLGGLFFAGFLAGTVYGQAPAGQNPPVLTDVTGPGATSTDKVVLKVGAETVTQADLDFVISNLNSQAQQSLAVQGRRSLGEQYALMVLLAQRALSRHLEASPTFVRQAALQRRQLLAQVAYSDLVSQVTVSPEETRQFYSAHQNEFETAQIHQVVILKQQEGAKQGSKGLPPQEARSRAEAIRKALLAGTDPQKVAEQFKVPDIVLIDAEPREVRRGTMRPEMEKVAFQLKNGEISDVFDLPQAFVLFQVAGHRVQELKDVSGQIENSLRQQKVEAALAELKKQETIWMDDNYFALPSGNPATSAPKGAPTNSSAHP